MASDVSSNPMLVYIVWRKCPVYKPNPSFMDAGNVSTEMGPGWGLFSKTKVCKIFTLEGFDILGPFWAHLGKKGPKSQNPPV